MNFTTLPFLVAFLAALLAMPALDIYLVNARGAGTERLTPWRRAGASLLRSVGHVLALWRAAFRAAGGLARLAPIAAGVLLLVLAYSGHVSVDALAVVPLVGHLNLYRQNAADLDKQLATNAERAQEISKAIRALTDKIVAGKSEMTEEDRQELAKLQGQQRTNAELRTAILQEKAANSALLAEAEAANELERRAAAVSDSDAEAGRKAAARVEVGQDRSELDPKRGFANHTEQMKAIIKAGDTGVVDPRLKPLAVAGSDEHGSHTNPHGGFLLAPAFAADVLRVDPEDDPTSSLVRRVPMEAERVVFNARVDKDHRNSVSGGLTVSRTPQTKAAAGSQQEYEQVELIAHDLCGVAYGTNRILRTSPGSFIALLQSGFKDEFASKQFDERLNGTGNGEFEGIIGADCTIVVAKETGQDADTITFANVNNMRARQWRYGRSIWLANNDTLPQVTTLYMPIGTSGERVPIYAPGDEAAPQGRLLGRPIFFTEFCQKLGDKGDIVNATWSEYLEGDFGGLEQSSSIHVRYLERQEAFMFVVMNDGRPWWRTALTPKYSTVTLSPFVTLAARA